MNKRKKEYGDFQTPLDLAERVLEFLHSSLISPPETIIEPTCGLGSFIDAAVTFFPDSSIYAMDINAQYIKTTKERFFAHPNVHFSIHDFFSFDWINFFTSIDQPFLVIGNLPWVTSSTLSAIEGSNLPVKSNFRNLRGIDVTTGQGNFDISESMLISLIDSMYMHQSTLAFLCKSSVARKVFDYLHFQHISSISKIFPIDAKKYFDVTVDACLFYASFPSAGSILDDSSSKCLVYANLANPSPINELIYSDGQLIANSSFYYKWKHLQGKNHFEWRSGLKHDATKVMVLTKVKDHFYKNGFHDIFQLEDTFLYPLLKSSDIANGRTDSPSRYVIVTQQFIGQDTSLIKEQAPLTWDYLTRYKNHLDSRKSSIYFNKPLFSIFGIGSYSFTPYKVAIAAMYNFLNFELVSPCDTKPVMVDDTVYFIPVKTKLEGLILSHCLNSSIANEFYKSFIFWDNKRPITKSLLEKLDITKLTKEMDINDLRSNLLACYTDITSSDFDNCFKQLFG